MTILDELGINEDEFTWQDLAACKNVVQIYWVDSEGNRVDSADPDAVRTVFDPVFDDYEDDTPPYTVRKATDELCLSCPVQRECYDYGKRLGETGVYGGVYLSAGSEDRTRNDHKSRETWDRVRKAIGKL